MSRDPSRSLSPSAGPSHERGCELQRLAGELVSAGVFQALPPPPLPLELRTACCGRAYAGSRVAIDGAEPTDFGEDGVVQLNRLRRGGSMQLQLSGVPKCLLLDERCELVGEYGAFEPESFALEVLSLIWVYWTLPEVPEEGEEELCDLHDEPVMPQGMIMVATNREDVPEEAQAVAGLLECPGCVTEEIVLDGGTFGPFAVRPAEPPQEGARCLLASLLFRMVPPEGYDYRPREPTPLFERTEELGGCELQRASLCPVAVGSYCEMPSPFPHLVALRTSCCRRCWEEASIEVDKKKASGYSDGKHFRVPPRPLQDRCGAGVMGVTIGNVPERFLPEGKTWKIRYGDEEPKCIDVDIEVSVWVYWVAPTEPEENEDDEEEEEDDDLDTRAGTLWLAVDENHVPPEAKPVKGALRCPGAEEEEVALHGDEFGPFTLRRPPPAKRGADGNPVDLEEETCLLASITLHVEPPQGYEYQERSPTPMVERIQELGGCELQRMVHCAQVVGYFKALPRPPLQLALRTGCCGRGFVSSATVVVGGRAEDTAATFDDDGHMQVSRKFMGGNLKVHLDGVLPCLLPGGVQQQVVRHAPFEPASVDLTIACDLWVYWLPPDEEEGADENDEPEEATVWVAVDPSHVPDEALPVGGTLECPGAMEPSIALDGISKGPFRLARAPPGPDDAGEPGCERSGGAECLLGALRFLIKPPQDYRFRAKDPSPLAERLQELAGCELERLVNSAALVGFLSVIQLPPLRLNLLTACCNGIFPGACLAIGKRAAEPLDEEGGLEVRRNKDGGELRFRVEGVPEQLMPNEGAPLCLSYTPEEPKDCTTHVECPLWFYWTPPADDPGDGVEEDEAPIILGEEQGTGAGEGTVWVAANRQHVPKDARPLKGVVECLGAAQVNMELDGASLGPFKLRRHTSPVLNDGKQFLEQAEQEWGAGCMLRNLNFDLLKPIEGYFYKPREPHPLQERIKEVGGCDLQRLAEGAVAMGAYMPAEQSPIHVALRTACCGRCFADAAAAIGQREAVPFDSAGALLLKRKRLGGELQLRVDGVPACLLPGGSSEHSQRYEKDGPVYLTLEIACPLWVYWVPPDPDEVVPGELAETTVWVALDKESLPDEALPIKGKLECPGSAEEEIELDGSRLGPFQLRRKGAPGPVEEEMACLLGAVRFSGLKAPTGYTFRARDPTPLTERCQELGGCETERANSSPVIVGYLAEEGEY